MQHSSLRFRHSTFHKQQSSFRIRPSSSVECTFICLHPATFSICPLSFRSDIRLWALYSQVSAFRVRLFLLVSHRWRSRAQLTLPTPAQMVVESRSTDFPVEWTRETFSTPDKPDVDRRIHHRVTMVADRQDTAAQSASLVTLLRVADRLSSMEKKPPPSKYRTTFVSYEEVVCSRRHKLHVAPASF